MCYQNSSLCPHSGLPPANGERVERAAGQDCSWGARRGLHAEGGKSPSSYHPPATVPSLSCKCSHLPEPAKTSWNKFQEVEKGGFMSIRISPGQEEEVSTELALPVLTSHHPSSKCWKGCQKPLGNKIQLSGRQLYPSAGPGDAPGGTRNAAARHWQHRSVILPSAGHSAAAPLGF